MDCICDWARDIYRRNILACLAGGRSKWRDWTPYSVRSPAHTEDQVSSIISRYVSPEGGNARQTSLVNLSLDGLARQASAPPEGQITSILDLAMSEVAQNSAPHPYLRWRNVGSQAAPWTRFTTIRHSNMVLFDFHLHVLPQDGDSLENFIKHMMPDTPMREGARLLLHLFLTATVSVTADAVLNFERLWIGTDDGFDQTYQEPVRAHVGFATCFRVSDWQIVRRLTCTVFTLPGTKELVRIADLELSAAVSPSIWSGSLHPTLGAAIRSLRVLSGKESVIAAALRLCLCLEIRQSETQTAEYQWRPCQAHSEHYGFSTLKDTCWARFEGGEELRCQHKVTEVLAGPRIPPNLQPYLKAPISLGANGAILLKKPLYWPESCPLWCLFVLKTLDFHDAPRLGRLMLNLKRAAYVNTLEASGQGLEVTVADQAILDNVVDELMGREISQSATR